MINIQQWAARHGVSGAALAELQAIMTEIPTDPRYVLPGASEAAISNLVRVEASEKGCWLMRNNVGACMDERGRQIRYGLANDSKQTNTQLKSCDLVGIRPLLITLDMVGCTVGQFLAREVKAEGFIYRGNEHEMAQLRFMNRIYALGGDAAFANGVGTI